MLSFGLSGCASASPPASVAPSPTPVAVTRGGVTYDQAAPLNAKITPKFDTNDLPPQALTYAATFSGGNNATVTANFVVPTSVKKAGTKVPAVLLLHGLNGRKEDVALLGVALANKGYVSLAIDIAGHGERPRPDSKMLSDLTLAETHSLLGQTTVDLRRAVDFLISRPEVDKTRLGFVGVSLGGIIGGVFLGDEPRIKTAVLWSSGGDWGKLFTTSSHPVVEKFRQNGIGDADTINTTLSDVEPLKTIGNFTGPLLLLYGDKDTIVPVDTIEELYNAAHDPKKRIIYQGGHIPDPFAMLAETIKWVGGSW